MELRIYTLGQGMKHLHLQAHVQMPLLKSFLDYNLDDRESLQVTHNNTFHTYVVTMATLDTAIAVCLMKSQTYCSEECK